MKYFHALLMGVLSLCALFASASFGQDKGGITPAKFLAPPESARPWVYWFWLNSNLTREGITADLEAMKAAGIGGVLIMEVDQGARWGTCPLPVRSGRLVPACPFRGQAARS